MPPPNTSVFPQTNLNKPASTPPVFSPSEGVTPLLQAQEKQIKSQLPLHLQETLPEAPSKIFADYVKTGSQALFNEAKSAWNTWTDISHKVANGVVSNALSPNELTGYDKTNPSTVFTGAASTAGLTAATGSLLNKAEGRTVYNAPYEVLHPVNSQLVERIRQREGATPTDIIPVKNKYGKVVSHDYGLYQINSTNFDFIKKQFKEQGKSFNPFNPSDSKEAAKLILQDGYNNILKSIKRSPTQEELMSSYNVGWPNVVKQIKQNIQGPEADKYVRASIFHG